MSAKNIPAELNIHIASPLSIGACACRLLRVEGAAPDHTQDVAFPEGAYLTVVVAAIF